MIRRNHSGSPLIFAFLMIMLFLLLFYLTAGTTEFILAEGISTKTATATSTPSATSTSTSLPDAPQIVATATSSETPIPTIIPSDTNTPIVAATSTVTHTPTASPTRTASPTPTPSPPTVTHTPTATPTPTATSTPTLTLGFTLRQSRIAEKVKAIVTNTTDEGFLDYSCIAFGVAFASVDNIIYYNIEDDGRILDHKDAIADALALNPQALEFNPDPRISNKHFHFEFSENLKELANVGYNPPGDFWISPVPSLHPPFTITLSLTDTQGIVAGPLEYGFSPSNLDCSEGDSSGGDTPGPITPTPTNTPRPPP